MPFFKRKSILRKKETIKKNLERNSQIVGIPYSFMLNKFKDAIDRKYESLKRKEIQLNHLFKIWEELYDEEVEKARKSFKKHRISNR